MQALDSLYLSISRELELELRPSSFASVTHDMLISKLQATAF